MVCAVFLTRCTGEFIDERFVPMEFEGRSGTKMPYRLFEPSISDRDSTLPLVVFLHGGRGAGTDNVKQTSGSNRIGAHVWTRFENQRSRPAFVAVPQLPGLHRWDDPISEDLSTFGGLAVELVEHLVENYPIDSNRVYLTGQSRGGRGVWDLIDKRPSLFAAAVVVCGSGNPARADSTAGVPVWVFHGARDRTIPVRQAREMVEAARAAGRDVEYTEYRLSGHRIWNRAFRDRRLAPWLFSKARHP